VDGVEVTAGPIGIGPVEAALGASSLLRAVRPERAVFVGTCGAFVGTGLAIGDVVEAQRSLLASAAAAAGFAYVPAPMQREARSTWDLGARKVACATTAAITSTAEHAAQLARSTGCEVEHLEAHAFLRACEEAGVPAACLLGVSNLVGPDAHEQWKANAAAATEATIEALLVALRRGGFGENPPPLA
jgi:nucleoside phosphorylase